MDDLVIRVGTTLRMSVSAPKFKRWLDIAAPVIEMYNEHLERGSRPSLKKKNTLGSTVRLLES